MTDTTQRAPHDPDLDPASVRLWHAMAVRDAEVALGWLRAVGFVEHATYRDERDPSVVVHAEWLWPGGGGVMWGSHREGGAHEHVGVSSAYLVVGSEAEVDALVERAVDAGGRVVRQAGSRHEGGRGATVADPDGNQWSVGTYQPGRPAAG